MRRVLVFLAACAILFGPRSVDAGEVEIIRDTWGVAHVFAEDEADGFFGVGYACAEDRLLQMDLMRRRARGRLAELFGPEFVDSDRKFRIAGIPQFCDDACSNLPADMQKLLRCYARGVNAFIVKNPESVKKRLEPLGLKPNELELWCSSDCIAAWMGVAELFDRLTDESAVRSYEQFQQLAAEIGEEEALARRTLVSDDAVAIVAESEFAKNKKVYRKLKSMDPIPGSVRRGAERNPVRFSHAWAVGGGKSTTGKPILESDPQTPVNNPALWYEFHLKAGRYDVRGISMPGCPGMLIGWNRHCAWGASALGTGCDVVFIEKLTDNGRGYLYKGKPVQFDRRLERIDVKGGQPVVQEVLTNRHGFVFNSIARQTKPGEAYVSYYKKAQDKGTSVRAMLAWMRARNYKEFREAMRHYYSPGIHVVYADADNNIAYQTLVHVPLTKRSPRLALEGWTGEDEVLGRIPLDEMPYMLNPDSGYISHANNMPVGSWYPYDIGIGTGATGDSDRSMRLRQILGVDRKFSVEDFEAIVHRDNLHAPSAALLPVARKVVAEDGIDDPAVLRVLDILKDWDGRFDASKPEYSTAMALAGVMLTAYRGSPLRDSVGGGWGGICHLARIAGERFAEDGVTPADPMAREYLIGWLRMAGGGPAPARAPQRVSDRPAARAGDRAPGRVTDRASDRPATRAAERTVDRPAATDAARPAATRPAARPVRPPRVQPEIHMMPYQVGGPLKLPGLAPEYDLKSPPLTCGQIGTIWSQKGNSYTMIVDLSDIDNSRSVLPPGVSENPDSKHRDDQIEIWAKGSTHPAPLSRDKIEAMATARVKMKAEESNVPDVPEFNRFVVDERIPGTRFIPAIPKPTAPAGGAQSLPGRKPDDAQLEAGLRYLIRRERTPAEVDTKIAELKKYIAENDDLKRQLIGGLRLVIFLEYGTDAARAKMTTFLRELGGELPPKRTGARPQPPANAPQRPARQRR